MTYDEIRCGQFVIAEIDDGKTTKFKINGFVKSYNAKQAWIRSGKRDIHTVPLEKIQLNQKTK